MQIIQGETAYRKAVSVNQMIETIRKYLTTTIVEIKDTYVAAWLRHPRATEHFSSYIKGHRQANISTY